MRAGMCHSDGTTGGERVGLDAPIGTTTYCCDNNYICVYCYICVWIFTYAWGYFHTYCGFDEWGDFSHEIDGIVGYAGDIASSVNINGLCYIGQHIALPKEHAFRQ